VGRATKRARQLEGRPCLTFNRLPTYLHQVTNDQRQNKVGIKVHAVGHGADEKGAELYQGMIKQIENSSNADTAYDTAVNSAAGIGFGFWRLITDYESPTSFNQVIKYQRIRDALKVYFDPASVEGDGSDAKQCVIVSDMPRAEFDRTYPGKLDACRTALTAIGNQIQPGWMTDSMVRVVEFYYFDYKPATLYLLGDGTTTTTQPPAGVNREEEARNPDPPAEVGQGLRRRRARADRHYVSVDPGVPGLGRRAGHSGQGDPQGHHPRRQRPGANV
jgi:hypothetical protein